MAALWLGDDGIKHANVEQICNFRHYAELRKITQALRKITHVLRKSVTQALSRYYAKYAQVTQINYADITQCLRINYAKMIKHNTQALRKYVYA